MGVPAKALETELLIELKDLDTELTAELTADFTVETAELTAELIAEPMLLKKPQTIKIKKIKL
ncbi:MAG: hypothetical protein QFX36_04025 [Archaeoglobales archaeon]|nr:hypothetical protein [Archaeoglobales archaeon]